MVGALDESLKAQSSPAHLAGRGFAPIHYFKIFSLLPTDGHAAGPMQKGRDYGFAVGYGF